MGLFSKSKMANLSPAGPPTGMGRPQAPVSPVKKLKKKNQEKTNMNPPSFLSSFAKMSKRTP